MDKHQASLILQAARPDGRDDGDAPFAEARAIVDEHPELGARLEAGRRFDRAIAMRLQNVPVPERLSHRLLADFELTQAARRRRRVMTLALAASIVLLLSILGTSYIRGRVAVSFASYREEMLGRLAERVEFSFASTQPSELRQWLESNRGVTGVVLPAGLQTLPGIGCRTWTWNGRPAGVICFLINGEAVHLTVISAEAVPHAPSEGTRQFERRGEWQTASWRQDGNIYLLAGRIDRTTLEKLM